ncbi:MAG: energy transducer TonB [Bacteroidales bacterium]|nr:energy transducer TonB [Bacteroidales bacterium]
MKQFILILALLPIVAFTQEIIPRDTILFFSKTGVPVPSKKEAEHYQVLALSTDSVLTLTSYYLRDKKWVETGKSEIFPVNDSTFMVDETTSRGRRDTCFWQVHAVDTGFMIFEFREGILRSRGFSHLVAPLVKEGLWIYYMPETAGLDRDETYDNNQLTEVRYWDEETDTFITDVYTLADVSPEFEGGDAGLYRFLGNEIRYPKEAAENGYQGRVFVNFIIMEDGSLKRIRLMYGEFESLNEEALRVVRMSDGKWKPGYQNGTPVRISYNLPIKFTLR